MRYPGINVFKGLKSTHKEEMHMATKCEQMPASPQMSKMQWKGLQFNLSQLFLMAMERTGRSSPELWCQLVLQMPLKKQAPREMAD